MNTGAAGNPTQKGPHTMKTFRTITQAILLLAVVAGLALGSGAVAFGADANYTDGTEAHTPDWGNPPEAPFIQGSQVCIDPPTVVWMTLHVVTDGTETDSRTFQYASTQQGFVCEDYTPPVCPAEEVEIYGTWNIGTGRSPSLFIDNDCPEPVGHGTVTQDCTTGNMATLTNTGPAAWTVQDGPFDGITLEPGATSDSVDVGRAAGALNVTIFAGPKFAWIGVDWTAQDVCPVVTPPAPPAQHVDPTPVVDVGTPARTSLAFTGFATWLLAGLGLALCVGGYAMQMGPRATLRRELRRSNRGLLR